MKPFLCVVALLAVFGPAQSAQPARVPVLVELFTSEGCSSCPTADGHIAALQRDQPLAGALVIPLALHVDYFDHAGWKDAFSSADFTRRQTDYSRVLGTNVYTPQVVVNGREAVVGTEHALVDRAIRAAAKRAPLPLDVMAHRAGDRARLRVATPAAPSAAEPIAVVAAVAQDGLTTAVTRGENAGRQLHHVAVARTLERIGVLGREALTLESSLKVDRAWGGSGLTVVVWLQGRSSRQVYGAAVVPLSN